MKPQFVFMIGLIICSFIMQPNTASSDPTLSFDLQSFENELIVSLVGNATYSEKGQFYGWLEKYYNDVKSSVTYFNGYSLGSAGIADVLLEYYNDTSVKQVVDAVANHLVSSATEMDTGIAWGRASNYLSETWLGIRYGTMGIVKFLTNYYVLTGNATIKSTIDSAIDWFVSQRENSGQWPMAPNDYVTMYYEYGMTGMGSEFLEMYQKLGENKYLDYAIIMANILLDQGVWEDNRFLLSWAPAEDGGETYNNIIFTSTHSGVSGILDFMLDLYEEVNDTRYLETAAGIGYDLVAREQNGAFARTSIGYITQISYLNSHFVGLEAGSAGISMALFHLYEYIGDPVLLKVTEDIEIFINSMAHDNGSVSISPDYPGYFQTSLDMGGPGLIIYYCHQYEKYGLDVYLNKITVILEHIHELWIRYGKRLPVDEKHPIYGYAYNRQKGMAGLLLAIQMMNKLEYRGYDVTNIFSQFSTRPTWGKTAIPTPNSSDGNDPSFLPLSVSGILILPVLIYLRRRKS